jgi:hypothetical protein
MTPISSWNVPSWVFTTALALSGTSNNTNSVNTLGQTADSNYNPQQMQDVLNKLDEFINAARR